MKMLESINNVKENIKRSIVHCLGGITEAENFETQRNSYELGAYSAYLTVAAYGDATEKKVGMTAEAWKAEMQEFFNERLSRPGYKYEGGYIKDKPCEDEDDDDDEE